MHRGKARNARRVGLLSIVTTGGLMACLCSTTSASIITVHNGKVGDSLANASPGTEINLDFRTTFSGSPTGVVPPVNAVQVVVTYQLSDQPSAVKLQLSTGDVFSIPYSVNKGSILEQVGAEPGTAVVLDFREVGEQTPSPLQPPLEVFSFALAVSSAPGNEVLIRLSSGEVIEIPTTAPKQAFMLFETSPSKSAVHRRPMPGSLKKELTDGVFDGQIWLEAGAAVAKSVLVQGSLTASRARPATNALAD